MTRIPLFIARVLLGFYKAVLSPVLYVLGVRCRHYPSCSDYAKTAMTRHGVWPGGWMALARLSRCHPFEHLGGSCGVDNVPEHVTKPPIWAPWRYGRWRLEANEIKTD